MAFLTNNDCLKIEQTMPVITGKSGVTIKGSEPGATKDTFAEVDKDVRSLRVINWVWDTSALSWVRMQQPTIEFSTGDLTITMGDVERLLAGNYWLRTKYDYDGSGNCIYKGTHISLVAIDDDTNWYITRFDWVAGNCTEKRVRVTSWTLRAAGW